MVTRVASRLETRTRAGDDIPMRHGLTHGLPFLLAYACALPAVGCTAAPAAGAPAAVPSPGSHVQPPVDPGPELPDLRLDTRFGNRPRPVKIVRNPLRFGLASVEPANRPPADVTALLAPAAPPVGPPPSRPADRVGTDDPDAAGIAGAPLRLIGLVDAQGRAGRVAVVTDEHGVYHGRAGDAIEGRYRIVSIGETSIEVEDLTRGVRMTLSLSEF